MPLLRHYDALPDSVSAAIVRVDATVFLADLDCILLLVRVQVIFVFEGRVTQVVYLL